MSLYFKEGKNSYFIYSIKKENNIMTREELRQKLKNGAIWMRYLKRLMDKSV